MQRNQDIEMDKAPGLMTFVRKMTRHCLWLSVLMHVLFLVGLTTIWISAPQSGQEKPPSMVVPSYAVEEPPSSPAPQYASQPAKATPAPQEEAKHAIAEKVVIPNMARPNSVNQVPISQSRKQTEAINLIGDKKVMPKPLIILLGKALTKHLLYPKIATDFRVRGISYIGFSIHPDGAITDVKLVRSSAAGVLDEEALGAVRAMSPVKNVETYVDKTRYMVVGIIFN